jgi:hypothetical protein
MPLSDKKLEKLQKLLEVAGEDFATHADLVKLTEALVTIVTKERDKLRTTIDGKKGEADQAIQAAVSEMDRRLQYLSNLLDQLDRAGKDAEDRSTNRLATEVSRFASELTRLERKIPTRTDLSGIEAEIRAIQAALVTVPTEITANPTAVRDALELLQPGDKLAIEAIENLRDELDELRKRPTGDVVGGPRVLRYLADVNVEGITNGQTIAWNSTTSKFEAATAGGAGVTSGATAPLTAPDVAGQLYVDTTNKRLFISFGAETFEDWRYVATTANPGAESIGLEDGSILTSEEGDVMVYE